MVGLGQVSPEDWDACLPADRNPFLRHAFLRCLEESGSATPATGWAPVHVVVERDGRVAGVAPVYAKSHSYGEFMFDWGWADALERAGGRYYPKLQVAVPFSPIPGPRLVAPTADLRQALLAGLQDLRSRLGASSIHLTFCTAGEAEELQDSGFLPRVNLQFHWPNPGYRDFGDFLGALTARKRKAIRRERREALQPGMDLRMCTGNDLTERVWDEFFPLYVDTYDRKWGSPHLTRDFFSLLSQRMGDAVVLFLVTHHGRVLAGALNLLGAEALYGRSWGCLGDYPFLHFEVCYYQAVQFAIQRRLARVEAGVQGPHKLSRGYLPVLTYGSSFLTHPGLSQAVGKFLARERRQTLRDLE
ncbi:MAG: GNAT family N-acetyltransferase, partial [Candidatus Eremiobacterota bacterium]